MDGVVIVDIDDHHQTPDWHPERAARLHAVRAGITDALRGDEAIEVAAVPAPREALGRVHDLDYVDALAALSAVGGGELDPDTTMSAESFATAVQAAGAGLSAVTSLQHGVGSSAFVVVRPPGHHAGRQRAMGFCLLNNVAIAAAALRDAGERVLIVDWDAHHGNGTQDIFWDDGSVLYASLHQWPAYPGTGRVDEVGSPAARDTTVNVPLPPGATGDVAMAALRRVVEPVVASFAPTWVLVSAGFDAHRDDPLTDLRWSAGDYARLATTVASWAPGPGRLVAFLEGGYDPTALRRSTAATIAAFTGRLLEPEPPTAGGPGMTAVDDAISHWHTM